MINNKSLTLLRIFKYSSMTFRKNNGITSQRQSIDSGLFLDHRK